MIVTKPKEPQSKSEKEKNWFDQTADAISYLESFRTFIIAASLMLSGYWISDSVNKASFVANNIKNLVEGGANRDIALIALDTAISPPPQKILGIIEIKNKCLLGIGEGCYDPVFQIARRLYRESKEKVQVSNNCDNKPYLKEREEIRNVMMRRKPLSAQTIIQAMDSEFNNYCIPIPQPSSTTNSTTTKNTVIKTSSKDSKLPRIVYIQYKSDRAFAENLRQKIQKLEIEVPDVERISNISANNIRYSSPDDVNVAKNLGKLIEFSIPSDDNNNKGDDKNKREKFTFKERDYIDLSKAGYNTPEGQVEIWLKY